MHYGLKYEPHASRAIMGRMIPKRLGDVWAPAIAAAFESGIQGVHGVVVSVADFVEAGGEEAGLDGEERLRIEGFVDGDEIGLQVRHFLEILEADDGESGGREARARCGWREPTPRYRYDGNVRD